MKSFGIIGGGISGLYSAYKLYKTFGNNINITIFERNNKLGGRIDTIHKDNISYEAGAGRFNKNHKLFFNLLKELELENKIVSINSNKIYIKDNKIININISEFINKIIISEKEFSIRYLKSITLLIFMNEIFTPSEINDFINAYGYHSEFELQNAYDSIQNLKVSEDYFVIKGGMYSIIESLINVLSEKGLIIKLNHEILDFNIKSSKISTMHFNKKKKFSFDKLIFCITKPDLLNIPNLIKNDDDLKTTLNTIVTRPLYRIYAKFPKEKNGQVWFYNMIRISTNGMLGNIIPINKEEGLIMISYTDGLLADMWNFYKNKKDLQNAIMKRLHALFPNIIISEPDWIDNFYWLNAVHYPQPYYKKYQNKNNNYFICGEVLTNKFNGWIEGSLLSVENDLKKLFINKLIN